MSLTGIENYSYNAQLNLIDINANTINNLSYDELTTLSGIDTSQKIQTRLSNLENGNIVSLNALEVYCDTVSTGQLLIDNTYNYDYPIQVDDGTGVNVYFKVSSLGNIYGTDLYIDNVLISFSSYITSSYLNTALTSYVSTASLVTSLLPYAKLASPLFTGLPRAPTALTTVVTNQIATCLFVQNYANANYQDYVTGSVLGGVMENYYQKADTDNEISIYTDASLTDSKAYTDSQVAATNTAWIASTAALAGTCAGLAAAIAGTNATVATLSGTVAAQGATLTTYGTLLNAHTEQLVNLEADVGVLTTDVETLTADVETIQTDIGDIQEKVFYETSGADVNGNFTRFNSNIYVNNSILDIIQLKNTGEILSTTITAGTGNIDVISGCVNAQITNGSIAFIDNCNTANINSITNLAFINGFPYSQFNISSGFSQW
jgi:hypothetical protein